MNNAPEAGCSIGEKAEASWKLLDICTWARGVYLDL